MRIVEYIASKIKLRIQKKQWYNYEDIKHY
jgi:hypothetical protein